MNRTSHTAISIAAAVAAFLCAASVLAASPEVSRLLDAPRTHPYLFFSADELDEVRDRGGMEPFKASADAIKTTAEKCLAADIPPEPDPGPDSALDENGAYTAYYLKVHYDFYRAGQQINEIVPSLAMGYLLTRDKRYLARAREWLVHYAGWQQWSVQTALADNQSAHSYVGLSVGYDWLWPYLSEGDRAAVLGALQRLGETFQTHRGGLAQQPLAGHRGATANNHTWVSHAAPLLGAVAQLWETPDAADWLDTQIICWRDKILPASLGRDGEYVDGPGGWLDYCLNNAVLPFVALKRIGGPDLFHADGSNLDRVVDFMTRANGWLAGGASLPPYHIRYALLALATAYQDPAAQWIATRNDLAVPPTKGSRLYAGMSGTILPTYEADRWYNVRMEWDAGTGHFRTSLDGRELEDLPMEDRTFSAVDRVSFQGHWRTRSTIDVRGLSVTSADGSALDWPDLSALAPSPLKAADDLDVIVPDGSGAEAVQEEGQALLRLRDETGNSCPIVGFRFAPVSRGAIEFQMRKSNADSYSYARLWEDTTELRGVIFYNDGRIRKHMPDYKNQDWPFGWRPDAPPHWFNAVWEFLFFDETLAAAEPDRGSPSSVFRDLGWVMMRDTWEEDGIEVFFRCGPEMGKDHGDNNAFRLKAFGEDLLPDLPTPPSGEKVLTQKQYDLYGWFQGTQGHNTILVDGGTQPAVWGDQTGRGYSAQWLAEPQEGVVLRGKLLSTLVSPHYDYASGDAWNAYTRTEPLLDRFRRDVMFVKPGYVLVFDDILATGDAARQIEWRMHTRVGARVEDRRMVVTGKGAALWATVVAPEQHDLSMAQTPAPIEKDKTPYFVLRPEATGPRTNILVALQPFRKESPPDAPPQSVEVSGGLGVRIADGDAVDLALFATDGRASAGDTSFEGGAAWLRFQDGKPTAYSLHRGARLAVGSRTLVEASAAIDLSVWLEGDAASAWINAPESCEVKLFAGERTAGITCDGEAVPAQALKDGVLTLSLQRGEHEVTAR